MILKNTIASHNVTTNRKFYFAIITENFQLNIQNFPICMRVDFQILQQDIRQGR